MNTNTTEMRAEKGSFRTRYELPYLIFAAAAISLAAYFFRANTAIYQILYIAFCVGGVFFSAYTPLCIRFATLYTAKLLVLGNAFSLINWALTIGPIVIHYVVKRKGNIDRGAIILLLTSAVIFFLSFSFGIQTRYTSVIMQCLYILAYLCASTMGDAKRLQLVMYGFIMSGVFVCFVEFTELLAGEAQWIGYGYRLTFNGNERDLANAMTIPAFYFLYKLFGSTKNDALFVQSRVKIAKLLDFVKLLPFFVLLFLSYSRGNYLAVLAAILYVMFTGSGKRKIGIFLTIFIVLIASLLVIEQLQIEMRYDQMMEYQASARARFQLWSYYLGKMVNDPIRLLFGFGPGDLKRIADRTIYQNFYAHSAFLDYLFAYGLPGFLLITFLAVRSLVIPTRNKDVFLTALAVLIIVTYLPFGAAPSFELHAVLGLCAGSVPRLIPTTQNTTGTDLVPGERGAPTGKI